MDIVRSINEDSKRLPFISSVVKQQRVDLGIKQVDFARKLGIGLKTLRKIEQGDLNISFQKLNTVLNYLGYELSPTEIITSPIRRSYKKLLKKDILLTLSKSLSVLKRKYSLKKMYLFGSYATGVAKEDSDIDVLIDTSRVLRFEEEEEIKLTLENLFKGIEVDLTIEKDLIHEFKDEIIRSRVEIKERV